jgi:hypothetical protein
MSAAVITATTTAGVIEAMMIGDAEAIDTDSESRGYSG